VSDAVGPSRIMAYDAFNSYTHMRGRHKNVS
jgi:hypothetical protein